VPPPFFSPFCRRQERGSGFTLPTEGLPGYDASIEPTATQTKNSSSERTRVPPEDLVRIVSTSGTCGGKPRIDGHRITVEDVAVWHERVGMSPDEIVSALPTITLAEVHAALAYYFENRERRDTDIREGEEFVRQMKAKAPCVIHAGPV
jgi:uncharacterized protein (DUF433 family)